MPRTPKGKSVAAKPVNPPTASRSRRPESEDEEYKPSWAGSRWLILIFVALPIYLYRLHYSLPTALPPLDIKGRPQPSEQLILSHIQALEDIGYRTVGTEEAKLGEDYVINQVRSLEDRCKSNGVLGCEVWVQTGSGFHEFTIMDHDVLKIYNGVRNVIMRIRAKNPPSGKRIDKDAVLLNSHIDSTLPAPGAADDAIGVGVMLDIARVLIDRNESFDNSVIFLWNGAEETLQDGSHLYSTQHETAKDVRTMINLEAAGSTGGAMLFQATSKEMVEAFSKAPHPRGTVAAADVFASGIMMSDTDFGQFEQYLNVSGLDMAIVGHSYFYHTQKDQIKYLEKGASQHFASNVQAAVDYLLAPGSPLSSEKPWSPPDVVYLSLYDRIFFSYSMETATKAYMVLASVSTAVAVRRIDWSRWKVLALAVIGGPFGLIAGILSANAVAGLLFISNYQMTWFRHEHFCMILFVPMAYAGHLAVQLGLSSFLSLSDRRFLEHSHYQAQLLVSAWTMLLLQGFGIRSAYLYAMIHGALLIGIVGHELATFGSEHKERISFIPAYLFTLPIFMCFGVEAVTTTLDIFTPLTGRMGKDAPGEFIVATISSACGLTFFPPLTPMFHRLSRRSQRITIVLLLLATAIVAGVFTNPNWKTYDSMHPKRAGVQYTYNHTTGLETANLAFMDSGPEFDFVAAVHERYGTEAPVVETVMNKNNTDWDVLYPISSFLKTFRFTLPPTEPSFTWPEMGISVKESSKTAGVRDLQIRLDFTGLVWPVLALNAEIVDWSFDFTPPKGHKRHHFKIATAVDDPIVDLSLSIKGDNSDKLSIHWIGIDLNQMVPGTAARRGPNMPGSKMLLDLHEWAKERYDDSLDILTIAAVAGVVEV